MGHRRFLAPDHRFLFKRSWFNGYNENTRRPKISTGEEIYREVNEITNTWGKTNKKKPKKRKHTDTNSLKDSLWKKKSVFFELPYWKNLLVRHNLDVMHIEKNICESIFGTLLNQKGKIKDGLNSRKDLEEMQIRRDLHPEKRGNRLYLPAAPHALSKAEKLFFLPTTLQSEVA
ncbi:PREDICTED: uncharacterized protein LOC105962688 [Erythranthe guttata]|uniref:uncharacterized protein LOC105962688 n=1 Tax=Erythranthe guttata TaxID=4155 RepID=UPI00064DF431|nr:PREDICTED: uncharacterized protein LOC105962688 [Erythranthe guttata]|eukprot:XP_012842457.1 PREDICTED: uncharacterized protein LOC105962688 [Erythranthe guttata]